MIVLNFHETYSTTFAKEGNMLGFLLPVSKSWWIGVAKYITGVIQVLPLVVIGTIIVEYKLDFNFVETITFVITLWLLCAVHLAAVVALSILSINMEFRDMGLLAGMIYEYAFGNVNPEILFKYLASLAFPAFFVGLLLGVDYVSGKDSLLEYIWAIDVIACGFVVFTLYLGKLLFRRKFTQLTS